MIRTFNFDRNLMVGRLHQCALQIVDWDSTARAETIQILDANTSAVLDTRSISSFSNGMYLVWNISGHAKINITRTAGNNAVVSGCFSDRRVADREQPFGEGKARNSCNLSPFI